MTWSEERTRFWARVFLGISLSVLLHVLVSVATYHISELMEQAKPQRMTLIEWIEPSDLKKEDWEKKGDQVVRKADLPKDLLDLNVKAKRRFLSEDKQTVKKEMRARASGMTENRSETDLAPSRDESQAARDQASRETKAGQREKTLDLNPGPREKNAARGPSHERLEEIVPNSIFEEGLGDIRVKRELQSASNTSPDAQKNPTRELLLPSDPRRNRGISTTGETLPQDIQIGDFTALNTDRFVYYTFYARVEEQIRHRWVRYVKAAIFGGGDLREGQADYVTNLEIVLDREGNFRRAIVHQGSGSKDVDAAPILAFREAQRIPHPPREMVKDDGTIRLLYSFHVDQLPPLARRAKSVGVPPGSGASASDESETN